MRSSHRQSMATVVAVLLLGSLGAFLLSGEWSEHVDARTSAPTGATHRATGTGAQAAGVSLAILRPGRGLALTPPMGWNGYNRFHLQVDAATVEAAARALVSSGMAADGYTYVNLDGGWDLPGRSPQGALQPDPRKFPGGIRAVADYVHSLGLKFGIYTSAGVTNCARTSAGSYGHYQQDAATFASWGVDYLKLDWCYIPLHDVHGLTRQQVSERLATEMADALAATGRPIVLDLNDTWTGSVGQWAAPVANLWRTAPDIQDSFAAMVRNFARDLGNSTYAGRGHWNDPDMLEVGNPRMSAVESTSQFSLWAVLAAPLIAGNDLTGMSAVTRSILTNRAVITVDQDPLGRQGVAVVSSNGVWVLTRTLADGSRAVVLFNARNTAATISSSAAAIGFGAAAEYRLLNLWTGATAETSGAISAVVPAHGVVMYRVSVGARLG